MQESLGWLLLASKLPQACIRITGFVCGCKAKLVECTAWSVGALSHKKGALHTHKLLQCVPKGSPMHCV
jgi:hypothetical protein